MLNLTNNTPDGSLGFTPEQVADGKHLAFVKMLLELGCEVRIGSDGYCTIIEYISNCSSEESGFCLISCDQVAVDGRFVNWDAFEADGNDCDEDDFEDDDE